MVCAWQRSAVILCVRQPKPCSVVLLTTPSLCSTLLSAVLHFGRVTNGFGNVLGESAKSVAARKSIPRTLM